MQYRTLAQLGLDVAEWSEALPRDVDLIVGIPRSGMLAATLLALHWDRPLTDLDGYLNGRVFRSGNRARGRFVESEPVHALVVDDSLWSGRAMREARDAVAAAGLERSTSFGVVYAPPGERSPLIDYFHLAFSAPRMFEWNILHHDTLTECCMDIDGVLCRDPGEMENDDGPAYAEFLRTVPARLVPGAEVGWLVTNRLERYRPETEEWLARNGIRYRNLIMHPAATGAERRQWGDHAARKAAAYQSNNAQLFIESDAGQAAAIMKMTGRPVYCTDTREMLNPSTLRRARGKLHRKSRSVVGRVRSTGLLTKPAPSPYPVGESPSRTSIDSAATVRQATESSSAT